jgi:HEAT repeat protein
MRKIRERIDSDYVLPLIDVLRNEDDVVIRRDAAEYLGRLRDKRAIEVLREVINRKIDEPNKRYKPPSGMIVFANPTEEDVKKEAKRSLGWIELPDEIIEELKLKLDRAGNTGLREAGNQILGMGKDAVPILKILLKNEAPGTRIRAIYWLDEIGKSEFSDTFIKILLEDKDDDVRSVAARTLANLKEPLAFDVLVKVLEDIPPGPPPANEPSPFCIRWSPGLRAAVAGQLGNLGDRRAIPYLEKALSDKYRNVRAYAARALHDLDSVGSVPLLIKLLKDKDDVVMSAVAEALGRLGDKRAIKPILNELNAGRRPYHLIGGLGWLRAQEAVKPVMGFLKQGNSILRREAARALGQIGSNKPVNALIGILHDKERDTRRAAAYALGRIGDNRAVPALIKALKDPEFVDPAAYALGEIGNKSAIQPLRAMLYAGSRISISAATALAKLGDEEVAAALLKIAAGNYSAYKDRRDALRALADLGNKSVIPELNKIWEHNSDINIRASAAYAITKLTGDEKAFAFLIDTVLSNEKPFRKEVAASALGEIGDKRAVEPLMKLIEGKQGDAINNAAEALGKLKDKRAIGLLVGLLNDPFQWNRKAAVEALASITGKDFGMDYEKWKAWHNKTQSSNRK